MGPRAHADAIPAALALYRGRGPKTGPDRAAACAFRARHAAHVTTGSAEVGWRAARGLAPGRPLRIAYLGVWDTVGALGVPGRLPLARWMNRGLAFHDTTVSAAVGAARHAVAIDERRRALPPTLWDNLATLNAAAADARCAQCRFPGDHGSVGGGGAVALLANDALVWVAEGAMRAGLALDPAAVAAWRRERDFRGPLVARRDSAIGRLLLLDRRDRDGPGRPAELAPATAARWRADPGYRPGALQRVAGALRRRAAA